jgi:transposase
MEVNVEVMHLKCAGLDVHKANVVACKRVLVGSKVTHETRTFGTTTKELLALSEWLTAGECTHVAMEATGVYWKPVWHLLEGSFELVLANAAQIKGINRPKTDVCDARWIADLLAHGLIRGSFVPERPIQELRGLTRTRKQLVQEQTRHVQRIQKTLEDANIKLDGVLKDIVGMSGKAMLRGLIAGQTDPKKLAALAHPQVKASQEQLAAALQGRVTAHHRFLLKLHLDQVEHIHEAVGSIDKEVEVALAPFRDDIRRLKTIPGVSDITAAIILAEVGADMSCFPTHQHLVSWAHLCPRNDESAGKRQSTRVRKGSRWLKPALIQVALGAIRKKGGNYLRAQFYRIQTRRGPKKARVAVAASILTAVYFILRDKVAYRDLGPGHFDRIAPAKTVERMVRRLKDLGYEVDLRERKAA